MLALLADPTFQDECCQIAQGATLRVAAFGNRLKGGVRAVTARKDDAPAAVQAAIVKVAGSSSISGGGGLIHTTSGRRQQRVDRDHRRGCRWRACS
jgi:hypothetical protein